MFQTTNWLLPVIFVFPSSDPTSSFYISMILSSRFIGASNPQSTRVLPTRIPPPPVAMAAVAKNRHNPPLLPPPHAFAVPAMGLLLPPAPNALPSPRRCPAGCGRLTPPRLLLRPSHADGLARPLLRGPLRRYRPRRILHHAGAVSPNPRPRRG